MLGFNSALIDPIAKVLSIKKTEVEVEAVEEVEASRPRTASARRAAMRSAEEAGDVIFFNQVGNEHRASERERESPEQKSFFPFLAKGSKQEQD